ncbi:ABC transporter ATP-binding protein [Metasolibacillus fluoroglycofenilyticus]|uniref:ABC transporter ATP-binding protein n=1 Tax=Metasolibacillus fluoroglycofenilyticus TaxID=1239396 RepID=UPI000D36ACD6|nr:ABC transporter ATP-binding protein [Metasolibacillus fluoroglycofenilyticus]
MTILEVRHLHKTYVTGNTEQHVLKDIQLTIKDGEFVSIMGPSGCGKSTLLYTVSGMDKASSGHVTFLQQNIATLTEPQLAKLRLETMGFIFQQHHLLKNLNLFDNIILSAYLAKKESRQKINTRATQLMMKMGIFELAKHDITQASGGQLQRIAICRALINKPTILFGDEPTGALNTTATAEVMDVLTSINMQGTTILLATHDAKVAAKTERILFMLDGEIIANTTLGKYNPASNDLAEREQRLHHWLTQLGF